MDPSISVHLLEFDRRFEQYGADFTFYDYNQPYELPSAMHHAYQVVIADPPYLVSTSRRFTLIRCSSPNHRTFPWEDDGRQLFQRASKKQPLAGTRKQSSSQEHEGTHSLARTDSPRHLAFVHSLRHFLPCSCRVRSAWRRSPGRSPFLPGLKTRACSCSQVPLWKPSAWRPLHHSLVCYLPAIRRQLHGSAPPITTSVCFLLPSPSFFVAHFPACSRPFSRLLHKSDRPNLAGSVPLSCRS